MNDITKNIRVPGVLWAIGLVVIIALIHENELWLGQTFGISPYMLDALVTVLIAVLKGMNLGTEQLEQALRILDAVLSHKRTEVAPGMRSAGSIPESVAMEQIPPKPSKMLRFWLG